MWRAVHKPEHMVLVILCRLVNICSSSFNQLYRSRSIRNYILYSGKTNFSVNCLHSRADTWLSALSNLTKQESDKDTVWSSSGVTCNVDHCGVTTSLAIQYPDHLVLPHGKIDFCYSYVM